MGMMGGGDLPELSLSGGSTTTEDRGLQAAVGGRSAVSEPAVIFDGMGGLGMGGTGAASSSI